MESANVVGFQNKAVAESGYNWMACTFEKVDGTVMKLSDLSHDNVTAAPTAIKLSIMNAGGATATNKEGKKQIFIYVHPAKCTAQNGWITGWYYYTFDGTQATNIKAAEFKKGSESTYWANDIEVPYGTGFGINKGSEVVNIVFSGSVLKTDAEIPILVSGYNFTGNVIPQDYKLKDLSHNNETAAPTAIKLCLFNAGGATKKTNDKMQMFVYVHPAKCTAQNGWITGWYYYTFDGTQATNIKAAEFKKGSESAYWANEIDVFAGDGFAIQKGSEVVSLIIPSPLADKE